MLDTEYGMKEFVCGNGQYILNHYNIMNLVPSITFLDPAVNSVERLSVYAAYEIAQDGKILITLRHYNTCHVQHWTVDTKENKVDIRLHTGDMICNHFDLTPVPVEE